MCARSLPTLLLQRPLSQRTPHTLFLLFIGSWKNDFGRTNMSGNTATSAAAQKAPPAAATQVEDVDDLDDLDDVLDEFNAPSTSAQKATTAAASTDAAKPSAATGDKAASVETAAEDDDDADLEGALGQDFAKELAEGMQALMKELGGQANGDGQGLMGDVVLQVVQVVQVETLTKKS